MAYKKKKNLTVAARLTNIVMPVAALRTTLLLPKRVRPAEWPVHSDNTKDEPTEEATSVPGDVTEGHFAVLASSGSDKMRRFVIGLNQLKNPGFLSLLEQTQEEYGFRNDGVLVVHCTAEELERILTDGL